MGTTISDVARRAGVSMKTVSRVMNNEPNVAKVTRERVKEAASALRYTPNVAARGLASARSFLLALIYDNPNSDYIMAMQSGAMKACRARGYHMLIESMSEDLGAESSKREGPEAQLARLLDQFNLGGVILTPPLSDNAALVRMLNQRGVRYVPVAPSAHHGDIPIVRIDDVKAVRQMTEYLISLGHTQIGCIRGAPSHASSARRFQGYREAMRGAGLHIHPDWIWDGDYTFRSSFDLARKHLARDDRPTAIFASNDDMAAGVVSAANLLGLSVPEDLSVCGFDDTAVAEIIWPRLTTVRQPVAEMGKRAANILMTAASQLDDLPKIKLEHEIIIRDSCMKPPAY